jgi:hypothetical protein
VPKPERETATLVPIDLDAADLKLFENLWWDDKQYTPDHVWPSTKKRKDFSAIEQFDDGVMAVGGVSYIDGRGPVIEVHDIEWIPD